MEFVYILIPLLSGLVAIAVALQLRAWGHPGIIILLFLTILIAPIFLYHSYKSKSRTKSAALSTPSSLEEAENQPEATMVYPSALQVASAAYAESAIPEDEVAMEAGLLFNQGNYFASRSEFAEALKSYESAILLDATRDSYYANYAATLKRMGNDEKAILTYQQAIEKFPNYAKGYLELANLFAFIGRTEEALKAYLSFAEVYLETLPSINRSFGGVSDQYPLYPKSSIESYVLYSLASASYANHRIAYSLFSDAVRQSSLQVELMNVNSAMESVAIYLAMRAANYMDIPEIESISVQPISQTKSSDPDGLDCCSWRLSVNNDLGDASSYGMIIEIYRSMEADNAFEYAKIVCGISLLSSPIISCPSNFIILVNQQRLFWATDSMYASNDDLYGYLLYGQEYIGKFSSDNLSQFLAVERAIEKMEEREPIVGFSTAFSLNLVNALVGEASRAAELNMPDPDEF